MKRLRKLSSLRKFWYLALLGAFLPLIILSGKQHAATPSVIIIEFSDFQCPYCRRAATVVEQLRNYYGQRVEFVFKQMPLRMHQHAFKAAQASVCAGEQGKFWEYHDHLFAANELSVDELNRAASGVGLNQADFSRCLSSEKSKREVERDMAEAERLGVSGTPTFFVNGNIVSGAASFASLKLRIDHEMDQRMMRNNHAEVAGISQREPGTNGRAATNGMASALGANNTLSTQGTCVPFPTPTVPACPATDGGLPTDLLSLSPSNPSLEVNCSAQFSALLGTGTQQCNFTGRIQQWTSSNPSVATIDASGNTLALSAGTTLITATEFIGTSPVQSSTTLTVTGSPTPGPTPTPTPAPQITLAPAAIDFGYQLVGTTSAQTTETVINSGTAPLVIRDIEIIGRDRNDFVPAYSFTLPVTVSPGSNVQINLSFTAHAPWQPGAREAKLKLKLKQDNDEAVVPLTGIGATCGGPLPACLSGCADSDGDGLNDVWELAGGIDLDNDGRINRKQDLLLTGAGPNKPDIYVQYDWMDYGGDDQSCVTSNDCRSFGRYHLGETCNGEGQCVYECSRDSDCTSRWPTDAHAGERCVSNVCEHTHDPLVLDPDPFRLVAERFAAHGINLHVLRGNPQPHSHVVSLRQAQQMTISCEGASLTSGRVGPGKYAASLYDLKAPSNRDKLKVAYHYALFAHYSGCDSITHCPASPGNTSDCAVGTMSFRQSGIAEGSGNDFVVSLGGVVNDNATSPRFQIAGTFMHELGHDLGLRHDGHLDLACTNNNGCSAGDTCIDINDGQGRVCHETVGGFLGAEEPNYKPNYLSIMNYRYELPFIQMGAGVGARVPLRCSNDFDCGGNGAVCLRRDTASHCSISSRVCTTGSDCTAGESCVPPTSPPNTCSTTAYVCTTDADCTGGDTCLPPSPGYCARMDYSSQTLPTGGATPGALDESNLDDTVGLGSGTTDLFTYSDGLCHVCWLTAPTTGPVNWAGTGVFTNPLCNLFRSGVESFTDTHVQADIDQRDPSQCSPDAQDLLHGHTDWPDLSGIQFNYKFQCTPHGAN